VPPFLAAGSEEARLRAHPEWIADWTPDKGPLCVVRGRAAREEGIEARVEISAAVLSEAMNACAARAAERDDGRDRANLRPAHKHVDRDVYNDSPAGKPDVHISGRPSGNSRAAFLRRLPKDRPDIHAKILADELSPHAGMIEAGFRKNRVEAAAPPLRSPDQAEIPQG
jgi:hypothetical protein